MQHSRSSRGPSGEIELSYEHSEAGGGHVDMYETAVLAARGTELVLTVSTRTTDAHDGSDSTETKAFSVSVDDLIELIEKNGRLVR